MPSITSPSISSSSATRPKSKDAVSLPIKLAVALAQGPRRRHRPQSSRSPGRSTIRNSELGPIIWKVFVNILEKAVTAPFALLGSLFGGGPDLQFIDFKPGAADLDPAGRRTRHRPWSRPLNARPQLKIEVPIAVVAELDRPRLVEAKLQAQIQEAQTARGPEKSPAAALPFDQLEAAARLSILARFTQKMSAASRSTPSRSPLSRQSRK